MFTCFWIYVLATGWVLFASSISSNSYLSVVIGACCINANLNRTNVNLTSSDWRMLNVTASSMATTSYQYNEIQPYDAEACQSSWVSHMWEEIRVDKEWEKTSSELSIRAEENRVSWFYSPWITTTTTRRTPLTLSRIVTSECDGFKRAVFLNLTTGIETITYSYQHTGNSSCIPGVCCESATSPSVPTPTCTISQSQCEDQWSSFQNSFSKWTTEVYSHWFNGRATTTVDINSWMVYKGMGNRIFGDCRQFESTCDAIYRRNPEWVQPGAMPSDYSVRIADYLHCELKVGRFALIHFPPKITSRDLCANEGFGQALTASKNAPNGSFVIANLTEIVFGAHGKHCYAPNHPPVLD
jgi:hypothetical protein